MSLSVAQAHAYELANTLMLPVLLIVGDEGYGVIVAHEYDGEPSRILHEFDPYDPAH